MIYRIITSLQSAIPADNVKCSVQQAFVTYQFYFSESWIQTVYFRKLE